MRKLLCVGASIQGGAGINAAANTGRQCTHKIIEALQAK
jgi:hypothetical protein